MKHFFSGRAFILLWLVPSRLFFFLWVSPHWVYVLLEWPWMYFICKANQLTGFYMRATLAINGLKIKESYYFIRSSIVRQSQASLGKPILAHTKWSYIELHQNKTLSLRDRFRISLLIWAHSSESMDLYSNWIIRKPEVFFLFHGE